MEDAASGTADALFGDAGDIFGSADTAASSLFDADPQNSTKDGAGGSATAAAADIAGVFGAPGDDAPDPFASVGVEPEAVPAADAGAGSVLDDYANQGWYDDDGTFHLYEDPAESVSATPASTTQPATSYAPTTTKTYTPSSYAPTNSYAPPQTTQHSAQNSYSPYAPPATSAFAPAPPAPINPYDPPAARQPSGPYAPPTNTYAPPANKYAPTNAYTPPTNAYTPPTNAYTPPAPPSTTYAPPTSVYAPPTTSYAAVPPPPPPAASTNEHLKYRSSSANAYDPPIPAGRRRIDSAASAASAPGHGHGHASPALVGPFGQTAYAPAQAAGGYGAIGHGAPPIQSQAQASHPPAPPRSRASSHASGPARTLSPADALGRAGSPLVGTVPGRVGSPLVRTVSPYDPPPSIAAAIIPPVPAHDGPPPPPKPAGPPMTGTKSAFDPPLPRTGTKSAFDPPMTGRKNAFDPPLTGRKNAFDPPLTGRKNAFDPPMTGRKSAFDRPPMTGTKSAFDVPPARHAPPPPAPAHVAGAAYGPPSRPASGAGGPPAGYVPPPRPKSAYDPPPRPASSASAAGRYAPGLDTNSGVGLGLGNVGPKSAVMPGPGSRAPWERGESVDGGRGSLDGADSGYKSRTSMEDSVRGMDDGEWGGDAEGGGMDDPEGGMKEADPEGGEADPEGGRGDDPEAYDEAADRTLVAPMLGVNGPKITATAPTPLASPGRAHVEFGDEEGGGVGYGRAASPAMRAASPAVSVGAGTTSRTNSISSIGASPVDSKSSSAFGHRVSPSVSKRPAPVVVEPPPNMDKYVVDTQPYTPMYGASPYADVQTSPPKKQASTDPYAPPKPAAADPYAPPKAAPVDPYAPSKPATDPYAPPKPAADPYAPSKFTGEPTQRITYSPPNGLARVYTPPPPAAVGTPATARPARNGTLGSRKSSMASVKEGFAMSAKDPYAPPVKDPYAPAAKDPYAPAANASAYAPPANPYAPPANTSQYVPPASTGPYAPPKAMPQDIKRPASTAYDPPMPAVPQQPHAASYTPGVPAEMYAPHRRDSRARDQGDVSDYEGSGGYISRYNYPAGDPYQPGPATTSIGTPAAYVPAAGGVDPLGRHESRAPIITFGFGGRMVTSFPGLSELTGGFDVSLGRKAAPVQLRTVHKVIPESALDTSSAVFPGPLFSDPGSPTKSLVSVGVGGSGAKTKKAAVIKYLGERAEEIERGLGYLAVDAGSAPGPSERSKSEGKLVLVMLLKVMVENDGRLSGTPAIDAAVRHALVPRLASAPAITSPNSQTASFSLASALDVNVTSPGMSQYDAHPGGDSPVATYKIKPSALDKIQEFLLQGERRQAYHYALDERMWAHAMLISSSLDKEAWKEVVNEFIRAELGVRTDQKKPAPHGGDPSIANGREPLRVAYSLFAGQGAAAVQELLPPKNLARTGAHSLMPPTMPMMHATPISPNFPQPVMTANMPTPALLQWQEIAATILSNQGDSQALTALGDYLISNKWVEAAHVCYLLSPATSPMGGLSTPSVRMVLLGSESPSASRQFERDEDAIIFSEIAEYAHSLIPTVKGQDAFAGQPHLQAYKLVRAARFAEMGNLPLATRYCEAISTTTRVFNRPSPFFTPCFIEQCKELSDRLSGVPQLDSSGSWISKKVAKPSLDSFGTWISGGLTKLIAGDGEELTSPPSEIGPKAESGAFSHYSAISSANTSQTPSPNASVIGLPTQPGIPPPRRSGSAMSQRPGSAAALRNGMHHPTDRAASAIDYLRPPLNKTPAVPPQSFSASAATTTFYQADVGYRAGSEANKMASVEEDSNGATYSPWWGDSPDESSGATPTAASFYQLNEPVASNGEESGSGFISLMDTFSPMPSPAPGASSSFRSTPQRVEDEEEEEDLGFGNSKKAKEDKRKEEEKEAKEEQKEMKKDEPEKKDPKEAAKATPELKTSSSWIGRWWSRKETDSPAPVKANLGEQMSLVYDKELKRWVNPNAPKPEPAAAPPPPPSRTPSRTQTGSPGPGPSPLGRAPASGDSAPPSRPQSTNSLAPPPPTTGGTGPRRVRSTLNESFGPGGDISSPEGGSRTSTPPASARGTPSRGPTPAGKRSIRSRYVDVFAEPPPSPST